MAEGWLDIPGTQGLRLFPPSFVNNAFTSNTFLIDGENFSLIVDSGSDRRRIAEMAALTQGKRPGHPVFLCLTHCHWDHASGVGTLKDLCGDNALIVAHATGAETMRAGDATATAAFLYHETFPPIETDIVLFGTDQALPHTALKLESADLNGLRLSFAGEWVASFYPLPGHTPDSIAIGIGRFLFCGDILFSSSPGIAGAPGWDRDALINSLECLRRLFAAGGYSVGYNGHGPPLTSADATLLLPKLIKSAGQLGKIAALDTDRADFLSAYACALLTEAERLFSILTAKIHKVSCRLELLEEDSLAAKLTASLDFESIESVYAEFREFLADESIGKMRMTAALKAVKLVRRIQQIFSDSIWPRRVDADLVRRLDNLFRWYMDTIQGCQSDCGAERLNPADMVEDVLREIAARRDTGKDYLDADDTNEAFLNSLIAALGVNRGLFESCKIVYHDQSGGTARASFDKQRLGDALLSILEILAAMKAEQITITICLPGPRMAIAANDELTRQAFDSDKAAFFKLTMRGHGARIDFAEKEIRIDFQDSVE